MRLNFIMLVHKANLTSSKQFKFIGVFQSTFHKLHYLVKIKLSFSNHNYTQPLDNSIPKACTFTTCFSSIKKTKPHTFPVRRDTFLTEDCKGKRKNAERMSNCEDYYRHMQQSQSITCPYRPVDSKSVSSPA